MDSPVTKVGNGFHPDAKNGNGNKHRLRIQGMAILERENQPNLAASYDYTTSGANAFFEEDVDKLRFFELNKIALGMTIHREDSTLPIKNGTSAENGLKNGSTPTTALKKFTGESHSEPYLTDVIWSRMDMLNPSDNDQAYIIKQYYRNGKQHTIRMPRPEGKSLDNFFCGFVTCLSILFLLWCILIYIPNNDFHW